MLESLQDYCRKYEREELLLQWNSSQNGELTPERISCGSNKKVWWICGKGHEWQCTVYARTERRYDCPYCAGKYVVPGRDFQSLYPDLAAQWHPQKNGKAKPDQFLPGSHRSMWWRCDRGHEWTALIKSRVEGTGCPYCSGRAVLPGENDLQTKDPFLAKQWHPTKNGNLLPSQVMPCSVRKVWWRCEQGHEWQAQVSSRTMGKGCPVCNGKLIVPGENDLESFRPQP